ncbi:ThuA domain-containing protein [Azospirillum thiophilum]|uniref:ThuA domain-containing protein n=1 Tax=Azospirillum thiophilum TaxID=528244 RepID=UPI0006981244|nr:ThuA domain-containing protein [Azospirillum thiophilum]
MSGAIRNLILTGGIGHPFADATPALEGVLAEAGVVSTVTDDIEGGLQALGQGGFDLLTVYALRWRMLGSEKYAPHRERWAFSPSQDGRERLSRFVTGGGGLLGLHTALICFDDWPEWKDLLGGAWVWGRSAHPPRGSVTLVPTAQRHPLTAGLSPFALTDEAYGDFDLAADVEPLATVAPEGGKAWPALWAREVGRGRAVADTLGHDRAALEHPQHRQILTRAALWACRRPF